MAIDWTQAITIGVVSVATPLVLRGMGKLFPSKAPLPSELEFPNKEVQKWGLVCLGLFFLFAPILGFSLWLALTQIYQWYSTQYESAAIFIGLPKAALAIPALFWAISLAYVPIDYFLRRKLGVRYEAYCLASARQYGVAIDSKKLIKVFGPIWLVAVVTLTVCTFKTKIVFYDDHLISCSPISCVAHIFTDISEIGQSTHFIAPNGNVVANRELFLRYKDGTTWAPFMLRGEIARQEEVAKFLSQKTGLGVKVTDMTPGK